MNTEMIKNEEMNEAELEKVAGGKGNNDRSLIDIIKKVLTERQGSLVV